MSQAYCLAGDDHQVAGFHNCLVGRGCAADGYYFIMVKCYRLAARASTHMCRNITC